MRTRGIPHLSVVLALIVFWSAFSSRAEAAWPKTGDVLVITRSFDLPTTTAYPYLVAVDPVTKNKTVIVDFSTFIATAALFAAGARSTVR